MIAILTETANINLPAVVMPESVGLLLFGIGLVGFAIGLRRIFNRNEAQSRKIYQENFNRKN